MASASANWKRPWQDDDKSQSRTSESHRPSQQRTDDPQGKEHAYRPELSTPRDPQPVSATQDEHRSALVQRTSFDSTNGMNEEHAALRSSPTLPSKRVRLDTSPVHDRWHEQGPSSRSLSQHAPHRPTKQVGYLEPRITDDAAQGETTRRQGFMSLVGPSPYEPIPSAAQRPRDMSTLTANRNLIREDTRRNCSTCKKACGLAPHLAEGLQTLQKQLKNVLDRGKNGAMSEGLPSPGESTQPPPEKLIDTLDFGIEKLNENMRIARDILHNLSLEDRSPSTGPLSSHTQYGEKSRARWEHGDRLTTQGSHPSPRGSDEGLRPYDYPPFGGREDRLTNKDPLYPGGPQGSHLARPGSPGGRVLPALPSPPGIKFTTSAGILPPMSPSVVGPSGQSAHMAHLQDLQHQLSTKSLAHQILQGEHEKLLAAYSRSQTRCNALDKKSQVSDAEINNLSEDRQRLQSQIEMYEQQVEELQASRDEAHKQSVANGNQYMQIMSMSSKLQAQGATDLKKYKKDRETWSAEKDELVAKIKQLEKSAGSMLRHDLSHRSSDGAAAGTGDQERESAETEEAELSGMSFERLKEEILALRRSKREAEMLIQGFKDEGGVIHRLTKELSTAGERLSRIGMPPAPAPAPAPVTEAEAMETE